MQCHDLPLGLEEAWSRSIPVTKRLDSVGIEGPSTLRLLKELDPQLRIMWDCGRDMVTIWRELKTRQFFLIMDNPFGREVDHRLYHYLIQCDVHRYGGAEKHKESRKKMFQMLQDAKLKEAKDSIDMDKMQKAWDTDMAKYSNHSPPISVQIPGDK